ncbi:MAG: AzlC family ABC transporter permease [Coriobacteriales bacterium]|nr:AzlC family ABC transporter permease [Coriobacteriales bacterium]
MGFKDVSRGSLLQGCRAALPIVVGYVALGLPAGILCAKAGMTPLMSCILAVFMYSGSGQYMIPNMFLVGTPLASLCASVSLVSSRQMLYGSALAPRFKGVKKGQLFWFASTVTDESFGVNTQKFQDGGWCPEQAQMVNTTSHLSWIISCTVGALLGNWLVIDTAIASFAMTSIFLCLLMMQKLDLENVITLGFAVLGVVICKLVGLAGAAILIGALLGVAAGMVAHVLRKRRAER